jgi:hypothetical protein
MKKIIFGLILLSLSILVFAYIFKDSKVKANTSLNTNGYIVNKNDSLIRNVKTIDSVRVQTKSQQNQDYFQLGIKEIEQMLKGQKPLDFKRAVFVTENAYYDGQLNWSDYSGEVNRIKDILNQMIVAKNLQRYKTAGNWAIFTYISDSIPENNYCPYQYDFENFMSETDYESMMVSRLLKIKKGNCHALPYLYKILANEVNVEAFIATAPMHLYIRHRDEKDKWWNLEMTTGTFSRTSFIMETFNVSDAGQESGLYMKALSEKESIALCILDLLSYYEKKHKKYSDDFVRYCYNLGLKYYTNSMLQVWKGNDMKYQLDSRMATLGLNHYQQIQDNPELMKTYLQMDSTFKYLQQIGYSTLTAAQYSEKVNEIKIEQNKLKTKK